MQTLVSILPFKGAKRVQEDDLLNSIELIKYRSGFNWQYADQRFSEQLKVCFYTGLYAKMFFLLYPGSYFISILGYYVWIDIHSVEEENKDIMHILECHGRH